MSEQQVSETDLQAYADGKLPEERRAAVAAWLAAHPEDAERIESYRQLAAELRSSYDGVLDEPVPERLERTIRSGRVRYAAMVAGWVVLGAVLGAIAGWQLHGARPALSPSADAADSMAHRAVVAHATYSPEVRHPVEVGADQEAHLVAWLSKRLGNQLRAPKLEAVGYSLVGGRPAAGRERSGGAIHVPVQSRHARHALCAFRHGHEPLDRVPLRARGARSACSTGSTASSATRCPRPTSARKTCSTSPTRRTSNSTRRNLSRFPQSGEVDPG
jgi:anti-sigma factor RsiW